VARAGGSKRRLTCPRGNPIERHPITLHSLRQSVQPCDSQFVGNRQRLAEVRHYHTGLRYCGCGLACSKGPVGQRTIRRNRGERPPKLEGPHGAFRVNGLGYRLQIGFVRMTAPLSESWRPTIRSINASAISREQSDRAIATGRKQSKHQLPVRFGNSPCPRPLGSAARSCFSDLGSAPSSIPRTSC